MAETLTYRAHAAKLMVLGLPLVGAYVASFAIHTTDVLMLGWYGISELAAATVASSVYFVVYVVGSGFGYAVTPLVAEAVEQGDDVRARRVTRMALWLSALFAVFGLLILWPAKTTMLLIGQTPEVAVLSQDYLRIAAFGMFPALGIQVMRSLLGAWLLTAVQLWITLLALAANAALNWALIFGNFGMPEMGIKGAAVASVVIQMLQFLLLAAYAHAKRPDYAMFQRLWRPDFPAMAQVFRLGVPIGVTGLAESGLFAASSVMMGWIGKIELAAHGIALQLTAMTFMFHLGMSQAATIRAGGQYGRRDEAALRRGGVAAYAVAIGFGALVVAVFLAIPGPLVSLFIDRTDPARDMLLQVGVTLIILSALFQFMDSTQVVALSLLRGVQDTTVPMWLAAISYWGIGVPASYVMAFTWGMGPTGLWLGLTVGLACAALSLGWRFWRVSSHIAPKPGV